MKPFFGLVLASFLFWAPAWGSLASAAATKPKSSAEKGVTAKPALGKSKSIGKSKTRAGKSTKARLSSGLHSEYRIFQAQTEAELRKEVTGARNVLLKDPTNRDAKQRLAEAAIATVDMLLAAEAVGNAAKAGRLESYLKSDLADVVGRVKRMAESNAPGARQALGYLYAQGVLLAPNPEKSCAEYRAAASAHAAAAWHWSQCQFQAQPVAAWLEIERAGGMGHAIAQEWLGRRCLGEIGAQAIDYACARDWLGRSASQGRARSQTLLAYLFNSGQGGVVDTARALRLYKLAAEQGDADAQNNLGEIYETGRGVEKSLAQAIQWYERAAERGLGAAQFNTGRLRAIGVGGESDPTRARAWLAQAEAKGVVQARQVLDWLDREVVRMENAVTKDVSPEESKSK